MDQILKIWIPILCGINPNTCGIYLRKITLKGCGGIYERSLFKSFEFQWNIYGLIYVISLVKYRFEPCVNALIIFRVFNNQKTELNHVRKYVSIIWNTSHCHHVTTSISKFRGNKNIITYWQLLGPMIHGQLIYAWKLVRTIFSDIG